MDITTILSMPNVSIIDVREPYEFAMGNIENAINIPLQQIPSKAEELNKLNGPTVFYCMSGNRSGQAVAYLESLGLNNIYNGGGIYEMQMHMESLTSSKS